MHERFIAIEGLQFGGEWAMGDTAEEAQKRLKTRTKRSKVYRTQLWRFWSELPFAPTDREATKEEADAYMTGDGSLCSIRAEREMVSEAVTSKKLSKK